MTDTRDVLTGIDALPVLPSVYHEILLELRGDDSSLHRVGELVAQDVAISSRILQVANSALYGSQKKFSDPVRATVHVGLESAKAIALSMGLISGFRHAALPAGFLEEFVDHSLNVGVFAQAICKEEELDEDVCDIALTAGLLHDLGRLLLASRLPELFLAAAKLRDQIGCSLHQAEREVFGTSHAEVGGYLIGLWGLPDELLFAVLEHHTPDQRNPKNFSPVLAVHVADQIHHSLRTDSAAELDLDDLELEELDRFGLGDQLPTWRQLCSGALLV